jgi:tryptophan synthase alpha chain
VITQRFASLRAADRRALVCYATAGHPDRARSLALLQGLEDAGADVLEVGVPFSDPVADGPVIQGSSQQALAQGMTFEGALQLIADAKLSVPVVLFSYLNPIVAAGPGALHRAKQAGAQGVLVTDLPVGEDPERERWFGAGPLDFVRLVAPTTPRDRMALIATHGRGFVYLISRLGVTGMQDSVATGLSGTLQTLREVCTLPICVGFGISTPAHAREVGAMADGIVVGSAIVRAAERSVDDAVALTRSLRTALDDR